MMTIFHVVMPLIVRLHLGGGTERLWAVEAFYVSRGVTALVEFFHHPIAEAKMAFLTFDAAVFSIEWQVFLLDLIAAWLPDITIQSEGYGSAAQAKS